MDDKKVSGMGWLLASSLIIVICSGCSQVQDLHHSMLKSIRSPGEVMEKTPEETSQVYFNSCKDMKPNMALLEADVIPSRVSQGKEISHRMRYAICYSGTPSGVGEIIRKVYHKETAVFQDRTRYEFKQGTWVIDAFIRVPVNAGAGVYEVDTVVSYRGKSTRIRSTFEIKEREN
jgi:hypothetical protein